MPKAEMIEAEATVTDTLPGGKFMVTLDNGHEVLAHICGKMRVHSIRIILGDKVKIEMSPYDLNRGRITFRSK